MSKESKVNQIVGRMLLDEVITPYVGSSYGDISELHILRLSPNWRMEYNKLDGKSYEFKREVAMFIAWYKEWNKLPDSVGSVRDCTGKPFRSTWTKLHSEFGSDGDFVITLQHSWLIDI